MNIFYLHSDPYKAATYHYDKHKVKMILEAAQMLCTAHHHYAELYEYDAGYIPYRKAHYNHPSTKWARENMQTYFWLYDYMMALGEEYTKRYKKNLANHNFRCGGYLVRSQMQKIQMRLHKSYDNKKKNTMPE